MNFLFEKIKHRRNKILVNWSLSRFPLVGCAEVEVTMLVTHSYLTLCDPMDCSLPGSSVHGIFQARILEWVVILFSRGSSWLRDWTEISCIVGWFFTVLSRQRNPIDGLCSLPYFGIRALEWDWEWSCKCTPGFLSLSQAEISYKHFPLTV